MHNNGTRMDNGADRIGQPHEQRPFPPDQQYGAGREPELFMARYLELHVAQTHGMRSDLGRLSGLIEDASKRLMTSFDAIKVFSQSYRAPPEAVSTEDVERAMNDAINALQFQDMVTQLVAFAMQRVALLEKSTESLGRFPQVSVTELAAAVDETVGGREAGPVMQTSMTGGTVDLF